MKDKNVYVVEFYNDLHKFIEIYENVNQANKRREQLSNDSYWTTVLCYSKQLIKPDNDNRPELFKVDYL